MKVLKSTLIQAPYEIREELWQVADEEPTPMLAAYSLDGGYIGDPETARWLCVDKGIAPERRTSTSNVCSIGFCDKEQKWYGWSHRAIYGFGVGAVVKAGDVIAGDIPVGTMAMNLYEARMMACAFAEGVS